MNIILFASLDDIAYITSEVNAIVSHECALKELKTTAHEVYYTQVGFQSKAEEMHKTAAVTCAKVCIIALVDRLKKKLRDYDKIHLVAYNGNESHSKPLLITLFAGSTT